MLHFINDDGYAITDSTTSGRTYHHNGDFSGEVHLILRPDEVDEDAGPGGRAFMVAKVPMEDLIDIVGTYVQRRRMAKLEDAQPRELLGLGADD